ncbi:MAG: phytase, partial [Pirellulales bacterium]|nr:phytase [Pirellulales bacterium]
RVEIDNTSGHLTASTKGLTIYYAKGGAGYLIASAQGAGRFVVYAREAPNPYLTTFQASGVTLTEGIDVANVPLGSAFPLGAFVAQNDDKDFRLVPWEDIAEAGNLSIYTGRVGSDVSASVATAMLDGTVGDDGLPDPPGNLATRWTRTSGPGVVNFADPFAADTAAAFSALGTYVLRLEASDGVYSTRDEVTVWVGKETELGAVDYWSSGDLPLGWGAAAYRFEATHDGILTAELRQGSSAESELRLYALGPAATAIEPPLETGRQRIDLPDAAAGQRYLLTVTGLTSPAEVCLANLVEQAGGTVTVHGTPRDDHFLFDVSAGHKVAVNGVAYEFAAAQTAAFFLDGLGGSDHVEFVGTSEPDNATLYPASGTFSGPGYWMAATGIESAGFDGAGGEDTVWIWGSSGANTYTARPGSAEMTGGGVSVRVVADRIYARGGGGADTATIWDSPGNDLFEFFPIWARVTGEGYLHNLQGFTTMIGKAAIGVNGIDAAILRGSPQGDWVKSTTITTRMLTLGAWRHAEGFDTITAYGRGGKDKPDTFLVQDTPGADTLKLKPLETVLVGPTYKVTAYGFGSVDAVRANVNAAEDAVTMEDSPGNDTLVGNPAWTQISSVGPAYANKATGFPSVTVYSTGEGFDRAFLSDSTGPTDTTVRNDTFLAGSIASELSAPGVYRIWTRFFDEVHGEARLGRDTAHLVGTTAVDELYGTAAELRLSGSNAKGAFVNHAKGFDEINALGILGTDVAVLLDAVVDTATYGPPPGVPLETLAQILWLDRFEKIELHRSGTIETTALDNIDTVFAYWD